MAAALRPTVSSWAARSLLLALLLVPASAAASCPPEDCLQIVPFPDVPYLTGDVDFVRLGADVTVRDAIAVTGLEITVRNDGSEAAEATLSMPLPDGAAILGFNLTIGERVIVGRVLERGQAQQEYDEAVEQGLDAALLQQADKRLVRLSLNIAPGEERVLRAAYAESVPLVGGSRVYRLPLAQLDPLPAALHIDVDVSSSLGAMDLKSSGLSVPLQAGKGVLDTAPSQAKDLVLSWREEAGARSSLVAASSLVDGASEVLGTLCLDGLPLARDVVFILDQSGSMAGLKMEEGRQALVASLGTVTPADRYSVVPFSNEAVPFDDALVAGTSSSVQAAQARAALLDIEGGTNIDAALQEAFAQLADSPSDRLPMVVLMTDGLPTVGVIEHEQIIERAAAANTRHAPIIVVPIGLDADYTFLATLALRSGGAYVDPGAPDDLLSERLERLAILLAHPVADGVTLTIDGADPDSIYPRTLPPIYADDCLEVRFRTTGAGPVTVHLSGRGAAGPVSVQETFAAADVPVVPAVRNLWGQALVAELLSQERVHGMDVDDDLRAAIIANATQYGVLSPYTAWVLVDEAPPEPQSGATVGGGSGAATMTGAASGSQRAYFSLPDQGAGGGGAGGAADSNAGSKDNKTPGFGFAMLAIGLVALAVVRRRL